MGAVGVGDLLAKNFRSLNCIVHRKFQEDYPSECARVFEMSGKKIFLSKKQKACLQRAIRKVAARSLE